MRIWKSKHMLIETISAQTWQHDECHNKSWTTTILKITRTATRRKKIQIKTLQKYANACWKRKQLRYFDSYAYMWFMQTIIEFEANLLRIWLKQNKTATVLQIEADPFNWVTVKYVCVIARNSYREQIHIIWHWVLFEQLKTVNIIYILFFPQFLKLMPLYVKQRKTGI